jgi:hypothetical protein
VKAAEFLSKLKTGEMEDPFNWVVPV